MSDELVKQIVGAVLAALLAGGGTAVVSQRQTDATIHDLYMQCARQLVATASQVK